MSTTKINTCDKDWFGKDYVFYDQQGNPVNILYDDALEYYTGKLFFPENGSDTFKTIEINTFERIKGFEYQQYYSGTQSGDQLKTQKFQLFNTHGIELIGNQQSVNVTKIEAVNQRNDYYSKWVYGENMDFLFPLGTEIKFNKKIFSINSAETYTVVSKKQDAILIITSLDNASFINNIGGEINNPDNYVDLTVSGVNAIKLYDYVDNDYQNNFPVWSEPNFYTQIFENQKLSIVNSEYNDGVYSVLSNSLGDNYYNDFKIAVSDLDNDLIIKVYNKTNNFNIYTGDVTFDSTDNTITLSKNIPVLLKDGIQFNIPSNNNNKTFTLSTTPLFNNVTTTYYTVGTSSKADQVLYENKIYHCVQSYTQSATSSVTPLNTDYWVLSNFMYVDETVTNENVYNGNIFLEDNVVRLNYTYDNTQTSRVNLATAFDLYQDDMDALGAYTYLDPLGEFGIIKSKYPTNYIDVEFYVTKLDTFSGSITNGTNFSPTGYTFSYNPHSSTTIEVRVNGLPILLSDDYSSSNAVGYFSNTTATSSLKFDSLDENTGLYWKEVNANYGLTASDIVTMKYITEVSIEEQTIERLIEIKEELISESLEDYSERPERRIVITDIDEFGLSITINEKKYNIESTIHYKGNGDIDLDESIDATLKSWLTKWRIELDKRGIFVRTEYFGDNNLTSLHNSLFIQGVYANIDLQVSTVVGETADYYYPDQNVTIYQMGATGSVFTMTINNRRYAEVFNTSVEKTLNNWVISHTEVLDSYGILIEHFNQSIFFKKKENVDINITVNVGKTFLAGEKVFEILKYWKGNEGLVISSNKLIQINPEVNFEEECFSTGQIISINNTDWINNNQEYNIIYLDPDRMILSYQGAFWGTIDNSIQSAFSELAFGENLKVGEKLIATVDNNVVVGEVTNVGGNTYQILYDTNKVATITRNNAWYYDETAINITVLSPTMSTSYIEVDSGLVDIDYYGINYKISAVSDNAYFIKSDDMRITSTLDLTSVTKQIVNPVNNLLYVLTSNFVYIIDPFTEEIKSTINNLGQGWDICCDSVRGDVYISYSDIDRISKISSTFTISSNDYYPTYKYGNMTYNKDEDTIMVFTRQNLDVSITSGKVLFKIDLDNDTRDLSFLITSTDADNLGVNCGYLTGGDELSGTIHYNEFNSSFYITNNGSLHKINTSDSTLENLSIATDTYYSVTLDSFDKYFWISKNNGYLVALSEENNIVRNIDISTYGYLLSNTIDSNIYIATADGSNELLVYSTYIDQIFHTFGLNYEYNKIIHNKFDDTIIGISSAQTTVGVTPISYIYDNYKSFSNAFNQTYELVNTSNQKLSDDEYGTLDKDYVVNEYLQIKTREFIRKPRKNYNTTGAPQAVWEYVWESDEEDYEGLFMVDISGDHLIDSGSYAYIGEKPLGEPTIRRTANSNLDLVDKSYAQQTVFGSLNYTLDYNDSETNISFVPEGIQTTLGFNSKTEGVLKNTLLVNQKEDISIDFPTYDSFFSTSFSVTLPEQYLTFVHNKETGMGEINLSMNSTDTFDQVIDLNSFILTKTNFEEGQILKIRVIDNVNSKNKHVSNNDKINVQIDRIFQRQLVVKYLDRTFTNEASNLSTGYLDVNFTVQPKTMVKLDVYGQTEIEDIRYKTELTNTGKLINPEDIFIFKEYDIKEQGVDWTFMNKKRKEMLMVRNDIYNYIGAYRSLINAINFFGFNDLELYEYFQNINEQSPNYLKLAKVEIPDIFDSSVSGWTENYKDYLFPNKQFEETKLFNLTYRLTDFNGTKTLTYSLDEVLIKLSGLKKWLEKNIIPITHKILDITGRLDFRNDLQVYHTPSAVNIINITDKITPINFNLNETYVLPVQSGSTVYNNVIEFFSADNDTMVDYFTLDIRTYRIHDLWDPFKAYSYGDRVKYYGKIYENVLIDPTAEALGQNPTLVKNTNNNPRLFENVEPWSQFNLYNEGNIVEYERKYYKYSLQTETANYLPWEGATGSCLTGTPSTTNGIDDNFYTDLVDRIGLESTVPNYWISDDNINSNFDVLDIVKENYPTQWCELLNMNVNLIESIAIDMINLPLNQYSGTKPQTKDDAIVLINMMIKDFLLTKEQYKFKYASLSPYENRTLDNADFILWDDISEWVVVDLEPVQRIEEFRSGDDMLLPFNFTIDTKIDPYVIVTCKSDNGYGQIKMSKKSYEIRFDADSSEILIKF